MQRFLGCLAVCLLSASVGATVAPSAYLTLVWVDGQAQAERYRQAFPGTMLVEHQRSRVAEPAPRMAPLSGTAPDRQAQSGERLGEVFFAPAESLLGLPPAPAAAPAPAPTP